MADKADVPTRRILSTRTELSTRGSFHLIGTLECGHGVITTRGETETTCVECFDEAKYGKPAPAPEEPPKP